MNRRQILNMGMAAAGFAAVAPVIAGAQAAAPEPKLDVSSVIGTNHGHELTLTPVEALEILRSTKAGGPVSLDIRGQSSHGHNVDLSHELVLALFVDGEIQASAVGGSHSHAVTIKLDVI